MPYRIAFALATLLAVLPAATFAQATASSPSGDVATAVITGQGTVSRPPDMATVNLSIQTIDDASANATAKNNATFAALTAALAALHVDAADIKTTYYNVAYVPRPNAPAPTAAPVDASRGAIVQQIPSVYPYPGPRYGYTVNRQLSITVSRVADVGAIIDAAMNAGATGVSGVSYGLKDRKNANEAALALALEDAANQARVVAAASHMRLGGIKQIQVGQSYAGPVPMPMRVIAGVDGRAGVPTQIPPTAVDVRATATVTYFLKP
jgi:uncharacterized protein YggE